MDSDDQDYMFDERWFHVTCSSNLSHIRCHTRAYFRFRWDLRIFMKVICSTIDDFMSLVFLTCRASDAILGHIFHFRWDLWIFTDVACSLIDDFMSPDLQPITSDAKLGHNTILDEIYRSWWSCALIPICKMYAETRIYSLSLQWFLSGASRESPN